MRASVLSVSPANDRSAKWTVRSTGCQKGNRECAYPAPRTTPKTPSGSKRDQTRTVADDSISSSEEDESAGQSAPVSRRRKSALQKPESVVSKGVRSKAVSPPYPTPSLSESPRPSVEQVKQENSLSPSTEASSVPASAGLEPQKFSSVSTDALQGDRRTGLWTHLPQDLQFFLDYHRTHLTSHHYFFRHEANHFLHSILIEHALRYDPLLYAVVGFAAFHFTVRRSNGKIQDFLGYYNKSVSLLRKSLIDNEKHTNATMMTILQLATFEVCYLHQSWRALLTECRITWATGSAWLVIQRRLTGCSWNYTPPKRS